MDNSIKFHVEGSQWSSDLSLIMENCSSYYRIQTCHFKQGDKKDYNTKRKSLYRLGEHLSSIIRELQAYGIFSVEISRKM